MTNKKPGLKILKKGTEIEFFSRLVDEACKHWSEEKTKEIVEEIVKSKTPLRTLNKYFALKL